MLMPVIFVAFVFLILNMLKKNGGKKVPQPVFFKGQISDLPNADSYYIQWIHNMHEEITGFDMFDQGILELMNQLSSLELQYVTDKYNVTYTNDLVTSIKEEFSGVELAIDPVTIYLNKKIGELFKEANIPYWIS